MFIILLSYTKPLEEVDRFLEPHKAWVAKGFADGVFVLSGGQKPRTGGCILALGDAREAIEAKVAQDPFVLHGVATAQVIGVRPGRVDERIGLLRST
jgi:uncharacterized protein YciI